MDFADKMLTVAVYADYGNSLRVVHEACGETLIVDAAEVRWFPEVTQAVDRHRCGGV